MPGPFFVTLCRLPAKERKRSGGEKEKRRKRIEIPNS
jgi:hypothetical protein